MSSPFSILGPATKTTPQRWFFYLFVLSFLSCVDSGHRRFSPSCPISSIGRFFRHIPSSFFVSRFTRPQTPEPRPECAQCRCSTSPLRSVSSARFVYCVQIGFRHFHRKISIYLHISKIFCNFAAQKSNCWP